MRLWKNSVSFVSKKDDLQANLEGLEHDRIDQSGHANTNGPASYAKPVTLSSQIAGEYLRGHQECDRAPGRSIAVVGKHVITYGHLELDVLDLPEVKQKQHSNSPGSVLSCFVGIMQ